MYYSEDLTHYITDAIEMVSSWDLSEDEFQEAVHQQAQLMSGIEEYFHDSESDLSHTSHHSQLPLDLH